MRKPFYLQKDNVYALPVLHYTMEMAAEANHLFHYLKPDCVAVELPETMSLQFLHGASRLPDISIVSTDSLRGEKLYYMIEPCDAAFEGLRCALEANIAAFCIDLDLDDYPLIKESFPDPYALYKIGYQHYYELCVKHSPPKKVSQDSSRELHMAKRLKELSLRYEKVLFIGGMAHTQDILNALDLSSYPILHAAERTMIYLTTPDEDSLKNIMAEWGWISTHYEEARASTGTAHTMDRQKLIYALYKHAGKNYTVEQGEAFPGYNLRNIMKFVRNYALLKQHLLPDLYQLLSAAKGCVNHNYAYEVWQLATEYPFHKNVDNLPEESLTPEEVWGHSKIIRFHMRAQSRKSFLDFPKRKDKSKIRLYPPGPFTICSFPPEDVAIENFGHFLQKKGTQLLTEEAGRTIPFTTSIEDGIDTRETIRHFSEKKLYVKSKGKPPGGVGSVVMIFDEDAPQEGKSYKEHYPWHTTWLGEHAQESDMAFYATPMSDNVVGPGISRCEYGGFMMSYPPRRLLDVWNDPDYEGCRTKAEVLLVAAIDYALKPIVVYVASKPPRSQLKSFARRFGKKIVYIPIGQLSPTTLQKLRHFHVLDGHDKREIAGEYIY